MKRSVKSKRQGDLFGLPGSGQLQEAGGGSGRCASRSSATFAIGADGDRVAFNMTDE